MTWSIQVDASAAGSMPFDTAILCFPKVTGEALGISLQ